MPRILREPRPTVTPLSGNESEADSATLAGVCRWLWRYSSHAYLTRTHALFRAIVDAFTAWSVAAERCAPETVREWARTLQDREAAFERGLALVGRGRPAAGYPLIAEAVGELEPLDPRDDMHFSLGLVLQELGALAPHGSGRVGSMTRRIECTLTAAWSFEGFLAGRGMPRLPPPERRAASPERPGAPPARTPPESPEPAVATGEEVPRTGLWIPATYRYGCPNLLVAGTCAPVATRACERFDYAALLEAGGFSPRPAWSDYEFTREPTVWRLLQADPRHRGEDLDDGPADLDPDDGAAP